jgi:hypothetical protein
MTKDSQLEIANLQRDNFQIVSFRRVFKIEAKMLSNCFI